MKHTPGPWDAIPFQSHYGTHWGVIAINPTRGRIDSAITGMTEADARLIAAAPDLLESLRGLVEKTEWKDGMGDYGVQSEDETMIAARKAIAKAECK